MIGNENLEGEGIFHATNGLAPRQDAPREYVAGVESLLYSKRHQGHCVARVNNGDDSLGNFLVWKWVPLGFNLR